MVLADLLTNTISITIAYQGVGGDPYTWVGISFARHLQQINLLKPESSQMTTVCDQALQMMDRNVTRFKCAAK